MYKVITAFNDLQDNNYPYSVGATYPRNGVTVSEKRLAELASANNRRKTPMIEKVAEKKSEDKKDEDAPKKTTATKKRSK
jgi:hypothetical protein